MRPPRAVETWFSRRIEWPSYLCYCKNEAPPFFPTFCVFCLKMKTRKRRKCIVNERSVLTLRGTRISHDGYMTREVCHHMLTRLQAKEMAPWVKHLSYKSSDLWNLRKMTSRYCSSAVIPAPGRGIRRISRASWLAGLTKSRSPWVLVRGAASVDKMEANEKSACC